MTYSGTKVGQGLLLVWTTVNCMNAMNAVEARLSPSHEESKNSQSSGPELNYAARHRNYEFSSRRLLEPFFSPHSALSSVQRFHTNPSEDTADHEDDPMVNILVKYVNDGGRQFAETMARAFRAGPGLQKRNVISATMKTSNLVLLDEHPEIQYWEHDVLIRPLAPSSSSSGNAQVYQWDMQIIQANTPEQAALRKNASNSYNDGITNATNGGGGGGNAGNTDNFTVSDDNTGGDDFADDDLFTDDYYSTASTTATTLYPPLPVALSQWSPCNDPNSFRIGVIDSGTYAAHPDLPCVDITNPLTNCIGETFGLLSDETWYEPTDVHGTHVFGTIGALGDGIGVHGVNQDRSVCYISARIFGRMENAETSSLLEALDYLDTLNVNVINLSLGGGTYLQSVADAFEALNKKGVISVAASGNDGMLGYSQSGYPASYPGVLSVGAIMENTSIADFSTFNEDVDLAAPGVGILSTAPAGESSLALIDDGTAAILGMFLMNSVLPKENETLTGPLVNCPNLGASTCPGNGGHICLIERGTITFENKALNCENGGGIAAIIYNNEPGLLSAGTLATPTEVTIPVMGLSTEQGNKLIKAVGSTVHVRGKDGYAILDGTSMATPHVTGAAGLIWRHCRDCTSTQVIKCLEDTAMDLGETGRDMYYGFGLVQVASAYQCLINTVQCCDASSDGSLQSQNDPSPTSNLIISGAISPSTSPPSSFLASSPSAGAPVFAPTSSNAAPPGSPTKAPVRPTSSAHFLFQPVFSLVGVALGTLIVASC